MEPSRVVSGGLTFSQGISDTPAWIVSKANMYARLMGKTPFVIYQGAWSILQRDFERDIIPMAREEGIVPSLEIPSDGSLIMS